MSKACPPRPQNLSLTFLHPPPPRTHTQELLAHGADPSLPMEDGCAALHIAAGAGDAVSIKLLVEAGEALGKTKSARWFGVCECACVACLCLT